MILVKYARDVARGVARYRSTARSFRRYAEFAEYYGEYSAKNHPGCGEGFFSMSLRHLRTTVSEFAAQLRA